MIVISLTTAVTLYLLLALGILLWLWLRDNLIDAKKIKDSSFFRLYICEYCQFPYLDESDLQVTRCPQCRSMNKDNVYKSLRKKRS